MNHDYFWKQQYDLPAGAGYPLWGKTHFISIFVVAVCICLILYLIRHMSEAHQQLSIRVIPLLMVALETWKDLFLVSVHRFSLGYLPLHLCSIGIFVFLAHAFARTPKWQEIWGEIAFCLIMPGAMVALFDPDWATIYPVWNFMNLYSYVWHGLLVLYPALLKLRDDIHPTIRHLHWDLLFLCGVIPPIFVFDKVFKCNYFFINWPIPSSPLSWLASFMGVPGYLFGYAILVFIMICIVYICIWIASLFLRLFRR
ncbi:MAG: YwaF family protein [Butyrivibrio sp.]|jgi:hypothetical protein|nr:YwaF family protein [Butyrivibrio sp.]